MWDDAASKALLFQCIGLHSSCSPMNTQKLIEQMWTQVLSQRVHAGR